TGSATVIDLHAIHADVAFTGFGVARDDTRKGDKPTRVFGPALEDGKPVEREVVFSDDFLTGAARHRLGEELSHFSEHRQHFDFIEKALRRLHVHESTNALRNFVE